MYTILTLQ